MLHKYLQLCFIQLHSFRSLSIHTYTSYTSKTLSIIRVHLASIIFNNRLVYNIIVFFNLRQVNEDSTWFIYLVPIQLCSYTKIYIRIYIQFTAWNPLFWSCDKSKKLQLLTYITPSNFFVALNHVIYLQK